MDLDKKKFNMGNIGLNSNVIFPKGSIFANIHKQLGLLPGFQGLNDFAQLEQATQTSTTLSPLDEVRREAETIATDIVHNYGVENQKKPLNRYCKTMRRTVGELAVRHEIAFKGMVHKLQVDDDNAFPTFVHIADEIFEDGQINWGRLVCIYAFAAALGKHCRENKKDDCPDKIALYVGRYVANKLGKWILDNGGWVRLTAF